MSGPIRFLLPALALLAALIGLPAGLSSPVQASSVMWDQPGGYQYIERPAYERRAVPQRKARASIAKSKRLARQRALRSRAVVAGHAVYAPRQAVSSRTAQAPRKAKRHLNERRRLAQRQQLRRNAAAIRRVEAGQLAGYPQEERRARRYASLGNDLEQRAERQTASNVVASIDVRSQRMVVKVDGEVRHVWKVSTGKTGYATPRGTYGPQRMHVRYFSRKYYNSPMPYSIFFRGGYAIHGTTAVNRLGGPASHGCVRLATANARTLFNLVKSAGPRQTRIVIT